MNTSSDQNSLTAKVELDLDLEELSFLYGALVQNMVTIGDAGGEGYVKRSQLNILSLETALLKFMPREEIKLMRKICIDISDSMDEDCDRMKDLITEIIKKYL